VTAVLGLAAAADARAQTWGQQAELLETTRGSGAAIAPVAIDGDTALFGVPLYLQPNNSTFGTAFVFERSGGVWSLQQALVPTTAYGLSAQSVALVGDTAFVSLQTGFECFHRSAGVWVETELFSEIPTVRALTANATTLVVGAETLTTPVIGFVYAIPLPIDGTCPVESGVLPPVGFQAADTAAGDGFGDAIALDTANDILVGAAEHANGSGAATGAAYLFSGNAAAGWVQQQEFFASDGEAGDEFGRSVALGDGVALIGAPFRTVGSRTQVGTAYAFGHTGGTWVQQQELVPGLDRPNFWAFTLALQGTTAVIVPAESPLNAASIFQASAGVWSETQLISPNDKIDPYFGTSAIGLDGTVIVGKQLVVNVSGVAAAYIFAPMSPPPVPAWPARMTAMFGVLAVAIAALFLRRKTLAPGR
jgi:hypothetical protein